MIRLACPDDVDAYVVYLDAHIAESGRDGDPVYAMASSEAPFDPQAFRARTRDRWQAAVNDPNWRRTFVAIVGDAVVGHCELEGASTAFENHRADLSLGVLRSHRTRGLGRDLIGSALDWARAESAIGWIDLGVFVPNPIAIGMYERLGFEQTGFVRDRYRAAGARLDEATMALDVSTRPS